MKRTPLLSVLQSRFPDKSKDELYASVMCGEVLGPDGRLTDPKERISPDLELRIEPQRFVSRGGDKLEAAIRAWPVPVTGGAFIDAGSSTGGFTDCLLSHGASLVHAVDVGHNQLAYRLRRDPRVYVHERTNVRNLRDLDPIPQAAVCDLSFRSVRGVLGHLLSLTTEGWGIALIKPQFELAAEVRWGVSEDTLTDGVLGSDSERDRVFQRVEKALLDESVEICAWLDSPVAGRQGNREALVLMTDRRIVQKEAWRQDLKRLGARRPGTEPRNS